MATSGSLAHTLFAFRMKPGYGAPDPIMERPAVIHSGLGAAPRSFRPVAGQSSFVDVEDFHPLTDSLLAGRFALPPELEMIQDESWLCSPLPTEQDLSGVLADALESTQWTQPALSPLRANDAIRGPGEASAVLGSCPASTKTYPVADCPIADDLRLVELTPSRGAAGTLCVANITFKGIPQGSELEFGLLFGLHAPAFEDNIEIHTDHVKVKFRIPSQQVAGGCEVSVQAILKTHGQVSRSVSH